MKTMTFSGRTMREAIAQAKARFGGDVDILDSDAVGDEVQVTVVVPMARSARRRRALEQVSASINALAASGRTAANGPDSSHRGSYACKRRHCSSRGLRGCAGFDGKEQFGTGVGSGQGGRAGCGGAGCRYLDGCAESCRKDCG